MRYKIMVVYFYMYIYIHVVVRIIVYIGKIYKQIKLRIIAL